MKWKQNILLGGRVVIAVDAFFDAAQLIFPVSPEYCHSVEQNILHVPGSMPLEMQGDKVIQSPASPKTKKLVLSLILLPIIYLCPVLTNYW
jgi:hypothetical protein